MKPTSRYFRIRRHIPMLTTAVIAVVSAIIAASIGHWYRAVVAVLTMIPAVAPVIVEKWAKIHIPLNLQWQYAALLLAGPYVGEYLGMYQRGPWDKFVHFYSGFAIGFGIVFALGLVLRKYQLWLPLWVEVTILVLAKGFLAMVWEVAEFFWDLVLGTSAQDHNFDTMTDMMLGTLPAVFTGWALVRYRNMGRFTYIGSLLNAPQPPDLVKTSG